ncbi:MAG: ATP-binding protein [Planctomycetota bacterium]|nr:ATP-binding protein [Planctomycetota bacterium]MDA1212244.1 ATP-binding protein [Planctomycetota bacterium]
MKRPSPLFLKVLLAYVVITAITTSVFVLILFQKLNGIVEDQTRQRLHQAAVAIRAQLYDVFEHPMEVGVADADRLVQRLSRELSMPITLVLHNGAPFVASDTDPEGLSNLKSAAEINGARTSEQGIGVSEYIHDHRSVINYAVRVGDRQQPLGYVRVSLPLDVARGQLSSLKQIILWSAFSVAIVSIAITYLLGKRWIQPIDELSSAARMFSEGAQAPNMFDSPRESHGELGKAVHSMTAQLTSRIHDLETRSEELKRNRDQLETVLAAMVEGVLVVDRSERILLANQAARKLLDIGSSSSGGRLLWEVVRNVAMQKVVHQVLGDESMMTVELDLPRSQSLVSLVATRLPGDPCPGVLMVLHDITELHRLENLRRDFVSNVSHELKTPLAAIQAYAETLLDGALEDDQHSREFVQRIEEQASRLHFLILDLLNLARLESEQKTYEVGPVSVAQTVENCLAERLTIAASKDVELLVAPPAMDVTVMADSEGLHTILDNLIDNAVKYTPIGGRVTVHWKTTQTQAIIDVADTGMGIPQEHQTRIFERFYRVDKARSRELGGTGLGLSIVKHLCQLFDGSVEVSSQIGSGTTFTVKLPLADALSVASKTSTKT